MERWDKLYRLRLFSPIEGELCPSDRMMGENISLTAYEMELYEELIRDSLKQAELLGENNGKLWQYFSDEIPDAQYPLVVSGSRILWRSALE